MIFKIILTFVYIIWKVDYLKVPTGLNSRCLTFRAANNQRLNGLKTQQYKFSKVEINSNV